MWTVRDEGVEEGDALPVLGKLDEYPRPPQVPLCAIVTLSCLLFHLQHDEHGVSVPLLADGEYTQ